MWSAGNGGWLGRNVRRRDIKRSWSEWCYIYCVQSWGADEVYLGVCSQLRRTCPNSLIARELDQLAASMG